MHGFDKLELFCWRDSCCDFFFQFGMFIFFSKFVLFLVVFFFFLYAEFLNLITITTISNYCLIISLFITYHHFNHVCLLLEFLHLLLSDDNMDPSKDWIKIFAFTLAFLSFCDLFFYLLPEIICL